MRRKNPQNKPLTLPAKQNQAIYCAAKAKNPELLPEVGTYHIGAYDPDYFNGMSAADRLAHEGEEEALIWLLERGANIHTVAATVAEEGNEELLSKLEERFKSKSFYTGMLRGYARTGYLECFWFKSKGSENKTYRMLGKKRDDDTKKLKPVSYEEEKPILSKKLRELNQHIAAGSKDAAEAVNAIIRGAAEGGYKKFAERIFFHFYRKIISFPNALLLGLLAYGDIDQIKELLKNGEDWWVNNFEFAEQALILGYPGFALEIAKKGGIPLHKFKNKAVVAGNFQFIEKIDKSAIEQIAKAALYGGHLSSPEKILETLSSLCFLKNLKRVAQQIRKLNVHCIIDEKCLQQASEIWKLRQKGFSFRFAFIATRKVKPYAFNSGSLEEKNREQPNGGALFLFALLCSCTNSFKDKLGDKIDIFKFPPEIWLVIMEYIFETRLLSTRETNDLALSIKKLTMYKLLEGNASNIFGNRIKRIETFNDFFFSCKFSISPNKVRLIDNLRAPKNLELSEMKIIVSRQIEIYRGSLWSYQIDKKGRVEEFKKNVENAENLVDLYQFMQENQEHQDKPLANMATVLNQYLAPAVEKSTTTIVIKHG